jgi:hypothetical protein
VEKKTIKGTIEFRLLSTRNYSATSQKNIRQANFVVTRAFK